MIDVYIVDGLAPELLDRWHDDLPTFAKLKADWDGGTYLSSGTVPYETTEMISVLTGAPIDEHGIYSYWIAQPELLRERPRVTTWSDVRAPWIWEAWEGKHRLFSASIPGTNEPTDFPGTIVSYPMQLTLGGELPPGTLRRLMQEEGKPYPHDVTLMYQGEGPELFYERADHVARAQAEAVLALRRREKDDMSYVSCSVVDRLSHYFWDGMEQRDRDSALFRAYRTADDVLASYLAASDGRPTIVFSEMGFGPLSSFVSFNDVLVEHGYQVRDGDEIDWSKTVAYEAVQATHGVNLCLKGRQPDAWVDPNRADELIQEISEVLEKAVNPKTGAPLVSAVKPGPTSYGPDILMTMYDERWLPYGDPRWSNFVGRYRMTGWHRYDTVWFANGVDALTDGSTVGSLDISAAIVSCMEG